MSLTNGTKNSTHEQCSRNRPSVFSQGCNFPFHATAAAIKGLLGSVRMLIHLCVSESVTPSLQRSTQNQVIEISKVRDRDKCKFSDFKFQTVILELFALEHSSSFKLVIQQGPLCHRTLPTKFSPPHLGGKSPQTHLWGMVTMGHSLTRGVSRNE